jgi:hypothetical protein
MGLFEDSRSKFNGSGSKVMIVCQRKYSFVQRKRIFLYITVYYFLSFPGARVLRWWLGNRNRKPAAMGERVGKLTTP